MASPTVDNNYLVETNAQHGERLISAGRLLGEADALKGKPTQTKGKADVLGRAKDPSLAEQAKLQLEDPLSHPKLAPLWTSTSSTGAPKAPAASSGDSPLLPSPGLAYFVALIMNEANKIYSQLELADNEVEQNQLEYYDAQADEYAQKEKDFYHAQMVQAISTTVGMAAMGALSLFALGKSAYEARGIKGLFSFGLAGDGGTEGELENLTTKRDFLQGMGGKSATLFQEGVEPAELEIGVAQSQDEAEAINKLNENLHNAEMTKSQTDESRAKLDVDYKNYKEAVSLGDPELLGQENQFQEVWNSHVGELQDGTKGPALEEAEETFNFRKSTLDREYEAAKETYDNLDNNRSERLDNTKEEIKKLQTKAQERAAVATQIGTIGQSIGQGVQQSVTIYSSTLSGIAAANKAIADRKRTDGQMGLQAAQGLFSGAAQSLDSFFSTTNTVLNAVFQAQRA